MNRLQIYLLISHEWIARPQEYVPLPTHWAIFISPDIRAEGTLFNTLGAPFYGYTVDVRKNIRPVTSGGAGWLSLGLVHESKLERLEEIAKSTPEPVGKCRVWAKWFIERLVDEGVLHEVALQTFEAAPKKML
ncbi:hypothetical protein CDV31_005164 [Fusarium ambrosium]|uniref:Uncharacterized protein n=1 Tax=Fusarium ambrosium TaxID=131363 RepID=A0A428ULH9_9HYPO|nr:hypothetical protein CDV31_005164 [Fusarium ambrosium]